MEFQLILLLLLLLLLLLHLRIEGRPGGQAATFPLLLLLLHVGEGRVAVHHAHTAHAGTACAAHAGVGVRHLWTEPLRGAGTADLVNARQGRVQGALRVAGNGGEGQWRLEVRQRRNFDWVLL